MGDRRETGVAISDIAFTPAVKAVQERKGSRKGYAKMEAKGGWNDIVTDDLAAFIKERDSFYIGTANAEGQPYIQHRQRRRPALHPAPRRQARIPQGSR